MRSGCLRDDGPVVAAGVGHVPGVQAERHGGGLGELEEAGDAFLAVDVGVGVRVEHLADAVLVQQHAPELGVAVGPAPSTGRR